MNKKYLFEQIDINEPLKLDCGDHLENYSIAFKTFGKLNKKKNNAILICHALTGDQFCTGKTLLQKNPDGGIFWLDLERLLIQISFM